MRSMPCTATSAPPVTSWYVGPSDQSPVPGEQCRRGHPEHLTLPTPGDQPRQVREPQPVARLVADPADLAAQHRVLVPEHQEFGILRHLAPGQHHQTAEQTTYDQVEDRKDHSGMILAHNTGQARSSNRAPQARGQRSATPVLANVSCSFPGRPVPPWPAAIPGEPFEAPSGRGITRLASDATTGRCAHCGRAFRRRMDGTLTAHDSDGRRCAGGGQPPAEDTALATWLPVLPGLTPHGLRHGHQTWMEEAGISDLLRSERMGHEVPGMRGVYGHVTPAMRVDLTTMLQDRWKASLRERERLSSRSIVPVLDALLAAHREPSAKIGSHSAPKIGHQRATRLAESRKSGR
jgi:hypothetical protein